MILSILKTLCFLSNVVLGDPGATYFITNSLRLESGLEILAIDPELQRDCERYAIKMAKSGNYKHCTNTKGADECIAINDAFSKHPTVQWMESPVHKKAILGEYTRMGLAIAFDGNKEYYVLRLK